MDALEDKISPEEARMIAESNWGHLVPVPAKAGDLILFGYPEPTTFKAMLLNFDERMMKAAETVGREFCSLLVQHGMRAQIDETAEFLQQEAGHSIGVAFMAASLYAGLLSRGAMDIAMLLSITLPRVQPGVGTALPLSPLHVYTLHWMALAVEKEMLDATSDVRDLFNDQHVALQSSRTVMEVCKPIWERFHNPENPGLHPALNLVSFREGVATLQKIQAEIDAEKDRKAAVPA